MSLQESPSALEDLSNPICTLCPLHEGAEWVCMMGSGPSDADVMIVGEAPGAREDEEGIPFIGAAGELLDELLAEAGLRRDECYVTNVAKCRPPRNRTPERKEIKTCVSTYLVRELERVQPRFLLLTGNAALQGVIGRSGITKHRGTIYDLEDMKAFATFHPAAVLRSPRLRSEVSADLARFARLVQGKGSEAGKTAVRVIRNASQLRWLIGQLSKAEVISLDIETHTSMDDASSLDDWHGERSRVVSIALSWDAGSAAFVPLHHTQTPWRNPDNVLGALTPALQRDDCKYIAHNGKYDCRWLAGKGIHVPLTFDTMLAAHAIDENRSKGLKNLSQLILGADAYDVGEELREAHKVPLKRLAAYNAKDADYTLRLYPIFKRQLVADRRTARVFTKLTMPASRAFIDIERTGMLVDVERWQERMAKAQSNVDKLRAYILGHVPKHKREDFNPASHPQVAEWLFTDLKLPITKRTPKGAPSSDKSVLATLAQEHKPVLALRKWREWTRYTSTYLGPWSTLWDHEHRLHPTYKLFGTVTHRLSCERPNLQNVPRNTFVKAVITAPPGWVLLEADYSQIELRIAAMLADETRLLRLFHAREDAHRATAATLTGKTVAEVTAEERQVAKHANFALIYAVGAQRLMEQVWELGEIVISLDEAERIRERFFDAYPKLRTWHDRQRRLARRYQRVVSPIGRIRHLPDITSGDDEVASEAERQAINSPVQSMASDLMLLSLVRLHARPEHGELFRIVGTAHDSGLFEVREDVVDEVAPLVRNTMLNPPVKKLFGAEITVPIEVEVKVGNWWGEGEEWDG